MNKWTVGLAALGLVSLASVVNAEESSSPLLTSLSSTTISGYADTSAQWTVGSGNANPPGYKYNAPTKQDGFNLNAVGLTLEKPIEEGDWSAGYKVDTILGPDAVAFDTADGAWIGGDLAIKQAYVNLNVPVGNGIQVKMGKFDSVVGYEAAESYKNPNFTRSYGHSIEPSSHIGALATYRVVDTVSVSAGIANTVNAGINTKAFAASGYRKAESYKTYMAAFALTAPESWGSLEGSALYAGVVNGYSAVAGCDTINFYTGMTVATPVEGLRVGAAYDYMGISKQPLTANTANYANATALYASFKVDKLSVHARGEYASRGGLSAPGLPTEVLALTGTVQYDLWENVISRLELRWDHSLDATRPYGAKAGAPNRKNEIIVAANVVYKF